MNPQESEQSVASRIKNRGLGELIERDLEILDEKLRALVLPHLREKDHHAVLNMACGRADETGVLAGILAEKASQVTLQGLDIRTAEIEEAQRRWADLDGRITADFMAFRGDRLRDISQLEDRAELVFLRHQNFWNDREVWTKIFTQSLDQLDDGGHLVITSYFDLEHELAVKALEKIGAVQVGSIRNEQSRDLSDDALGKSVDRHLAIFRKA